MKIGCDVIRDLLFLYEEDGCSQESRKLVEEHLKGCKECREYQKKIRFPEEMMAEKPEKDSRKEEKVIKNSFKKVRRRWAVSLAAVLLIFPMIGIGMMGYNEYMGEGICFTNLDEIIEAKRLLTTIEKGKYEEAAQMLRGEYERDYESIIEALEVRGDDVENIYGAVRDMTESEFCELMQQKFVEQMKGYRETGASFKLGRFINAQWCFDRWTIYFNIDETYADGSVKEYALSVDICDGTITGILGQGGPLQKINEYSAINGAVSANYWNGPFETE